MSDSPAQENHKSLNRSPQKSHDRSTYFLHLDPPPQKQLGRAISREAWEGTPAGGRKGANWNRGEEKPPFGLCSEHPRIPTYTDACLLQGRLAPSPPHPMLELILEGTRKSSSPPRGWCAGDGGKQPSRSRWESQVSFRGHSHPYTCPWAGRTPGGDSSPERPISGGLGGESDSLTSSSASGSPTRTPKIPREDVVGFPGLRRDAPPPIAGHAGKGSSRPRRRHRRSSGSDYKSQDALHSAARGGPWLPSATERVSGSGDPNAHGTRRWRVGAGALPGRRKDAGRGAGGGDRRGRQRCIGLSRARGGQRRSRDTRREGETPGDEERGSWPERARSG